MIIGNDNKIDDTMMIYISVTKVKQMVTDILEPVMAKQKSDTLHVKFLTDKSETFDRYLSQT